MFLQDMETVPPLLAVKIVPQTVPGLQGPRAYGKGEFALFRYLQQTDIKHLWDVFRLTYWKPVPVDLCLRPMHPPSMHHD